MLTRAGRIRGGAMAVAAAGIIAALVVAGCGATTSGHSAVPRDQAGYRVLAGAVPSPLPGVVESPAPIWSGGPGQLTAPMSPEVPSAAGRWWLVGSATGTFRRSERVELLATGRRPGLRFNLFWEDTCGGTRTGQRGVAGGSGASADLTLHTLALVLVRLPAREGTYDGCYLAATVSLHTRRWRDAKAVSPTIKIIHY